MDFAHFLQPYKGFLLVFGVKKGGGQNIFEKNLFFLLTLVYYVI